MNRIDTLSHKALALASQMGDSVRDAWPTQAASLLKTGAALGMARTGTRVAGSLIRRNPAMVVAAAAGAGVLWYLARRHQQKAQNGTIEGTSRRVEPTRASAPRKRGSRTRARSDD